MTGNRIKATAGNGIRVDGANNLVEKSKISDTGNRGVDLRGSGNVVTKNRVTNPSGIGLYVSETGIGNVFSRNTVIGGALDGARADIGGTTFLRNKIVGPGRHGIVLDGLGLHLVEGNSVTKAGEDALFVFDGTTNSMLIANKLSKSQRGLVLFGDDTLVSRAKASGNLLFDLVDNAEGTTVLESNFSLVSP